MRGDKIAEDKAIERITAALGPRAVFTAPEDMAGYLTDMRGRYQGKAAAVVRPGSAEEVASVVRICIEAGVPIVPQGGNTGLVGGGIARGGIVLNLSRMNRILSVDPVDFTMTVEAGCTLKAIRDVADEAGCLFPLSLPSEGTAQIGGAIGTNAGGAAVLRYGNTRDLVLGLEAVLPDGRTWNGLRRLRKDNTGYDLKQLFIGAEGTLGIVTAAVLKLFPKPNVRATALVGLSGVGPALDLFGRMRAAAADALTAFEVMPRFGMETVLKHAPGTVRALPDDHAVYALVELSSSIASLDLGEVLETVLGEAIEEERVENAVVAASEAQIRGLWRLREELSETQGLEGGSIKQDVSVPVSGVATFIETATAACEDAMPGVRVLAFGHVGDGNIHFNISQPVGMDRSAFLAEWERFNRIVHDIVVSMDGSISAEHGIGLSKREELAHYKDSVSLDLFRALKRTLDPDNMLNPGKIFTIS